MTKLGVWKSLLPYHCQVLVRVTVTVMVCYKLYLLRVHVPHTFCIYFGNVSHYAPWTATVFHFCPVHVDVRSRVVFGGVGVGGHQILKHDFLPLAALDVGQAQRVRAVLHFGVKHGRVVADPSCVHLCGLRSDKGEEAPVLEGLVHARVAECAVPVPQNGFDVLRESGVKMDGVEGERRRVDAKLHLHPVVTVAVGGVRVDSVNAHADLVARLGCVEDSLFIVQAEANAGVLDAGMLENDFSTPLI